MGALRDKGSFKASNKDNDNKDKNDEDDNQEDN